MTVSHDFSHRGLSQGSGNAVCLEDKFEVLKDIGDGSFGSVVLARVRSAGSHVARRGTMVAIKTMKKTFESFAPCLELREVIFLRSLPIHAHLVPALDIFLDPLSKKLHICMEYMDGNLYQLMKARDHKSLDGSSVKSILFQILSGLEHIHAHSFFHRDIKPENILVSTTSNQESGNALRRYSALMTPPSTPPSYTVKIADFGLARETHSKLPFTTYVSTRWYRAPEVLLRAGEYSAPVDIWAIGAMAVEIATLKPLFPGGNEVDQVWRVCEIMGSPGNWYNKAGGKVGGGDWREGTRLAGKLGFSFPKMAPHSIDTILQQPHWPAALSDFVTWCLMWDPKNRPTSVQALNHEYFTDAVDPTRPKSSASRILGRKHSDLNYRATKESSEFAPTLSSKPSWFRKSLIARESAPAVPQHTIGTQSISPRPTPEQINGPPEALASLKSRPRANKRATWSNGMPPSNGAPMPILPSIRPISPLSDAVTAQATGRNASGVDASRDSQAPVMDDKAAKKIGRQLSVASSTNHYADIHRQEAERALNGNGGLASPPNGQKESFFSHLRKRARRFSGRYQTPLSPNSDDVEASAGCGPWQNNRSSMAVDSAAMANPASKADFTELDRALQNVRYSLEQSSSPNATANQGGKQSQSASLNPGLLKRHHSLSHGQQVRSIDNLASAAASGTLVASRSRRAKQMPSHPVHRYETPDEEEELLDEVLASAHKVVNHLDRATTRQEEGAHRSTTNIKNVTTPPLQHAASNGSYMNPYPTPSPSARQNNVLFGQGDHETTKPLNITKRRSDKEDSNPTWPTPPYEENEWAAAAAASIYAAGAAYR
ncbi:MAG: hypothetical protein M1827_004979 [Pycnora praestabilis]|nr:MAG: hypothetical protein M1827_004979 [Pycnora praestabilis]